MAMPVFLQQFLGIPEIANDRGGVPSPVRGKKGERERVGLLYGVPSRLSSSPHAIDRA